MINLLIAPLHTLVDALPAPACCPRTIRSRGCAPPHRISPKRRRTRLPRRRPSSSRGRVTAPGTWPPDQGHQHRRNDFHHRHRLHRYHRRRCRRQDRHRRKATRRTCRLLRPHGVDARRQRPDGRWAHTAGARRDRSRQPRHPDRRKDAHATGIRFSPAVGAQPHNHRIRQTRTGSTTTTQTAITPARTRPRPSPPTPDDTDDTDDTDDAGNNDDTDDTDDRTNRRHPRRRPRRTPPTIATAAHPAPPGRAS